MVYLPGIGDVITIVQLAFQLASQYKSGPPQYKVLAGQVEEFAKVLSNVNKTLESKNITPEQRKELADSVTGAKALTMDLKRITEKFKSLGSAAKKFTDRLKWDQDEVRALQGRLSLQYNSMNAALGNLAFRALLALDVKEEVKKALKEYFKETGAGRRAPETLTNISSHEEDVTDSAWTQLVRDLQKDGITPAMVNAKRNKITQALRDVTGDNKAAPLRQPSPQPPRKSTNAITGNPKDSELEKKLIVAWNKREWGKSINILLDCVEILPPGADFRFRLIHHLLGVCLSYAGDFQEAKESFIAAIQQRRVPRSPKDYDILLVASFHWLADTCLHLGQRENAALAGCYYLQGLASLRAGNIAGWGYECLKLLGGQTIKLDKVAADADIFAHVSARAKAEVLRHAISLLTPENAQYSARNHSMVLDLPGNTFSQTEAAIPGSTIWIDPRFIIDSAVTSTESSQNEVVKVTTDPKDTITCPGKKASWVFDTLMSDADRRQGLPEAFYAKRQSPKNMEIYYFSYTVYNSLAYTIRSTVNIFETIDGTRTLVKIEHDVGKPYRKHASDVTLGTGHSVLTQVLRKVLTGSR